MYLIALCDDETAELNKTEQIISDYEKKHPGIDFLIERFENVIFPQMQLIYFVFLENLFIYL